MPIHLKKGRDGSGKLAPATTMMMRTASWRRAPKRVLRPVSLHDETGGLRFSGAGRQSDDCWVYGASVVGETLLIVEFSGRHRDV